MKPHHWIGLCLGIAALPVPAYVLQYNAGGTARRWNLVTAQPGVSTNVVNPATRAIRYFLASDGWSATNTAAELNAVRAAFAQWQSLGGTTIKFEDAGLVAPPVDVNLNDDRNVVFWTKNSTLVNGGNDDIEGAAGVAFTTFNSGNIILESDIVFNGTTVPIPGCANPRRWITDASDPSDACGLTFVEAVALHEIGHLLGLAHSPAGAATMLFRGIYGAGNLQIGLDKDDIAGVRFLYAITRTNVGAINGTVTKNGSPILGAQVFVQDFASNVVAGTVTRSTGAYEVNMLPPGEYQVRIAPLDPAAGNRLVAGVDIGSDFFNADTDHMPTTNISMMVVANVTNTLNLAVQDRTPPFRITYIRAPTASSGSYNWSPLPAKMTIGQSNYHIGVASANLPTANASLHITGDGLILGAATFNPNAFGSGLNFISVPISVSSNATPGPRSFVVSQSGTNVAYANGFLEIQPAFPDYNFDGLDDLFQRAYFPLFTLADAGPNADPDGDGMNNFGEYVAGTIPTNAASLLKVQNLGRTNHTVTVRWGSVVGKNYRVLYSTNPASGSWSNVASVVTAIGTTTALNDTAATNGLRTYRVQVLP